MSQVPFIVASAFILDKLSLAYIFVSREYTLLLFFFFQTHTNNTGIRTQYWYSALKLLWKKKGIKFICLLKLHQSSQQNAILTDHMHASKDLHQNKIIKRTRTGQVQLKMKWIITQLWEQVEGICFCKAIKFPNEVAIIWCAKCYSIMLAAV